MGNNTFLQISYDIPVEEMEARQQMVLECRVKVLMCFITAHSELRKVLFWCCLWPFMFVHEIS